MLVQTQTPSYRIYLLRLIYVLHATLLLARVFLEFFTFCQVLRGADRNIDFLIKDSKNGVLDSHLWTSTGSTDKEIKKDGNLVCFSQTFVAYVVLFDKNRSQEK